MTREQEDRVMWRVELVGYALLLLVALWRSTALADVTVNGSVSVTTPDGGFQLFDEHGEKLRFADHRIDTGRDAPLFRDEGSFRWSEYSITKRGLEYLSALHTHLPK